MRAVIRAQTVAQHRIMHASIRQELGGLGEFTRGTTPPSRNDIEDQFCTLSNRNGSSMANGRARLPDVLATAKLEGVVAGLVIPELREPADGPACSGAGGTAVDPP
jgi:hypothetical protein